MIAPRRPPRDLSARLSVLACLAACLFPACGPDDPAPEPPDLVLRPTGAAAPPALSQLVQQLRPAEELALWTIDTEQVLVVADEEDSGSPVLQIVQPTFGEPLRLARAGRYDLSSFQMLRVHAACTGDTLLSAAFLRQGVPLTATEVINITHRDRIGPIDVPLPPAAGRRGIADTLLLHFGNTPRVVQLTSVELVATPAASLVPPAGAAPALIVIGDHARRAVGLVSGHPLEVEFRVPLEARLEVSFGQPAAGVLQSSAPVLAIHLQTAHGSITSSRQPLEVRGRDDVRWHTARLALDDFAGDDLRVRFELLTEDDSSGACLLGVPKVWTSPRPVASGPRAGAQRPSVLLVTSDTHRGDHLGAARAGSGVETPALDALAADGVFFEDCFSSVNYTNPSHMALMTGRHPRDIGILDNKHPMGAAARTLAEHFRAAGYRTWGALSAQHLGDVVSGLGQGFDRLSWPERPQRPGAETLRIAERWLAEDTDDSAPLFLWVHVFDAHRPYDPRPEWLERYYDGPADPYDPDLPELTAAPSLPREMHGLKDLGFPRAQYKALVSELDAELARVLEHPRFATRGLRAVVGDHGESLGDHDVYFDHAELYPDTLHVPLILAGPDVPAGVRDARPVSHLDLGRTLLDLAGVPATDFPGANLLPTRDAHRGAPLAGDTSSVEAIELPRYALSSHGSSASLTRDGFHLILRLLPESAGTRHHQVELYDLGADPQCLADLVDTQQPRARLMRAQLVAWLTSAESTGLAQDAVSDPALLEGLRTLGYVDSGPGGSPSELWQPDRCDWCIRLGP